jgi:hypothetical protein
MMSVVRILLLILGIFAVVFGAAMYTVNQDFLEHCLRNPLPGSGPYFQEENCRVARGNVVFGQLSMIAGIALIILSMIFLITARINRMKATLNCPECRTTITRQSSPKNCANCGLPIDWSKAKAPQK